LAPFLPSAQVCATMTVSHEPPPQDAASNSEDLEDAAEGTRLVDDVLAALQQQIAQREQALLQVDQRLANLDSRNMLGSLALGRESASVPGFFTNGRISRHATPVNVSNAQTPQASTRQVHGMNRMIVPPPENPSNSMTPHLQQPPVVPPQFIAINLFSPRVPNSGNSAFLAPGSAVTRTASGTPTRTAAVRASSVTPSSAQGARASSPGAVAGMLARSNTPHANRFISVPSPPQAACMPLSPARVRQALAGNLPNARQQPSAALRASSPEGPRHESCLPSATAAAFRRSLSPQTTRFDLGVRK